VGAAVDAWSLVAVPKTWWRTCSGIASRTNPRREGIELAADRLSERGADLGRFGERPPPVSAGAGDQPSEALVQEGVGVRGGVGGQDRAPACSRVPRCLREDAIPIWASTAREPGPGRAPGLPYPGQSGT
jgi:hypothetical protein